MRLLSDGWSLGSSNAGQHLGVDRKLILELVCGSDLVTRTPITHCAGDVADVASARPPCDDQDPQLKTARFAQCFLARPEGSGSPSSIKACRFYWRLVSPLEMRERASSTHVLGPENEVGS
jgi:hypothetical protein